MEKAQETYVWTPAGFWIRAAALVIDSIVISLILAPATRGMPSYKDEHPVTFFFISFFFWGLYGALGNLFFQGSLGKKLLGLKIVDQYEGRKVGFWIVFFRDSVGRFVSTIPLFFGFIWAVFHKDRKTLHDHIFATRVVKRSPVAVYGSPPDESAETA